METEIVKPTPEQVEQAQARLRHAAQVGVDLLRSTTGGVPPADMEAALLLRGILTQITTGKVLIVPKEAIQVVQSEDES